MTGWEPATEAEVAMRDALRAQDQQLYFRILTRVDLLLPVAGPAPAGHASAGWGTWTTGGRTHVLAFTSVTAMRACLGDDAGATRRVPYADLAAGWPNHEWWLAVNPGLPIEGYLPAWFVAQLSRGDVRLPGRTMGARARLERVENAARARADVPGRAAPPTTVPPPATAPAGRAPAAPVGRVPGAPGEPVTVPFPAAPASASAPTTPARTPAPGTPARTPDPSRGEPPVPPVPRRPEPANGQLSTDRLGRLGPRGADEGASRDEWPGRPTVAEPAPGAGDVDGWPGRAAAGEPARRAGDVGDPARRAGDAVPVEPARRAGEVAAPADRPDPGPAADSLAGWVSDLRRRPAEPDAFDNAARPGAANGRSAPAAPPPARSFFEPASGRTARRPSPLDQPQRTGDRAASPSRFAQGGQPFPRRRPLHEPVPEDPTQAFAIDVGEATHALGPSRPEEPPRPFQPAPPPASADDVTQALPRRRPHAGDESDVDERPPGEGGPAVPPETEELPPSVAEPVSAPPAGRRGFSPIVIEGTVIESRDLTGPEEEPTTRPGTEPGPAIPEAYAVPTVPAAASAMATATAAPAYRADGAAPAAPWAGPAEPTVPLTIEPAAGESRSVPSVDGPTDPLTARLAARAPDVPAPSPAGPAATEGLPGGQSFFEPVAPPAEPTVPLFGGSAPAAVHPGPGHQPAEPAGASAFEPVSATDERTEPVLDAPVDRSLFEPAGPAQRQSEPAYRPAGPAEDPTEPLSAPVAPFPPERTEPSPAPGERPVVVAPPAWTAPSEDRTEPLGAPIEQSTAAAPPAWTASSARPAGPTDGERRTVPVPGPAEFAPANEVEEELLGAAGSGSTDGFLSTLLLARVLLPVAADSTAGSRPGDPGFVWHTEQLDGGPYVVVYTSPERLADRPGGPVATVRVKFVQLIRRWPDESWSFAVNPGTPVGATYPGEQVLALANWAAEVGLGDDPEGDSEPATAEATPAAQSRPAVPPVDPTRPVTMQKAIAPSQLAYYLERGYDRVSGFVHRANELAHLGTPAELYDALGLGHPDTPFTRDAEEIYVLRWPAYRPSLYRIPYGGQNEAAMRAMEGWVIERPPFRGNGFAPGESSDVVAEFKVDSARLPHGAQLWRIGADRTERLVAVLDTDALLWRPVGAS